jgi:hypothetical protein
LRALIAAKARQQIRPVRVRMRRMNAPKIKEPQVRRFLEKAHATAAMQQP